MLRKIAVQEYLFFYLLIFSQLFGVHSGSEIESVLLYKSEERLLGQFNDESGPRTLLSKAENVNAFAADLRAKTLYYYDSKTKIIYSKYLDGGEQTEEFSYNLEGLFRMEIDSVDNNLYFGINKKTESYIVACSLRKVKKDRACVTVVTEKQNIISFVFADRKFALLVNNVKEHKREVKIWGDISKTGQIIETLDDEEYFVNDIAYDYNKNKVIWATSKSKIGYCSITGQNAHVITTTKDIEPNSISYFDGKLLIARKEDGKCFRWSKKTGYIEEKDLKIGTVSAMITSYHDIDNSKSLCNGNKCPGDICISMKETSKCLCSVAGDFGNCEDWAKTTMAIGILISGRSFIQFYPDAMGIFHSRVSYKFNKPYSNVIGDYYIKKNSFIYSITDSQNNAEFYKLELDTKRETLIERILNIRVRSIAIDQRTGNIYYSSNLGIRILTEDNQQGRFGANLYSHDVGKIFINPFSYRLFAFRRHKRRNGTMVNEYKMDMSEIGQPLFMYEPKDAFGIEARRDETVLAGHVKSSNKNYKIVIEFIEDMSEKEIYLKTEPSHICPHGNQLFYTVEGSLLSYDLNSIDSNEKIILKSSDSIDVLKVYTKDFKHTEIETNACKQSSCSDVCVLLSEKDMKCICPSFTFLDSDKTTCSSSFCDRESEYYCKGETYGECRKYSDKNGCNDQDDCKDGTDEFDCEYNYWMTKFCEQDKYLCKGNVHTRCESKEQFCKGIHRPECVNQINETEICKDFKDCKPNEFKCKDSTDLFAICKTKSYICDGALDCNDGSDEQGCAKACKPYEFTCSRNSNITQCVSYATLCDGNNDCMNGFDEDISVCSAYCSKSDKFTCDKKGLTCVPQTLRCDDHKDCANGNDEKDCLECTDDKLKCQDMYGDDICATRCNGDDECDDESDEQNCNCSTNEVTCNLKVCIYHRDWCRNPYPADCINPRNIPNCTISTSTAKSSTTSPSMTSTVTASTTVTTLKPTSSIPPIQTDAYTDAQISTQNSIDSLVPILLKNCSNDQEFLCKDNTTCIHITSFCDYISDCPDGSDEGGLCEDLSVCNSNPICSKGICHKFPARKPICECNEGFTQTDSDCIDINECENVDDPCDQICTNLEGSFKCSCKSGYKINNQDGTCTSSHSPTFWLASLSEVYQYSQEYGLSPKWQVKDEHHHLSAMIFNSNIVLAELGKDSTTIYQFNKIHSDMNRIIMQFKNSEILGLAYDWINDNIYYTEYKQDGNYNDKGTIGVCGMKGVETVCKTLLKNHKKYTKIAVDPIKGYVYWIEFQGAYTIRKANMNFLLSSFRILFEPDIQTEPLLAVDYATNKVYSYYDGKIHSTDPEQPKKIRSQDLLLDAPKSMDFFENKMYFGALDSLIEYSIRSKVQKTIYRLKDQITYVLVSHELRQPIDSNKHEKACYPACSPKEICLMNPTGASCVQSDEIYTVTQQPTTSLDEFQTTESQLKMHKTLLLNGNESRICDFCQNGECIVNGANKTFCNCSRGFRGENCTLLDDPPHNYGTAWKKALVFSIIFGVLIILSALLLVCCWERLKKWSRKPLKMCAGLTTMIFQKNEDEKNLVKNPGFVEDVHEIEDRGEDRYAEMSYNSVGNDTANSDEPTVQLIIR